MQTIDFPEPVSHQSKVQYNLLAIYIFHRIKPVIEKIFPPACFPSLDMNLVI
jgi:hypothetical protein